MPSTGRCFQGCFSCLPEAVTQGWLLGGRSAFSRQSTPEHGIQRASSDDMSLSGMPQGGWASPAPSTPAVWGTWDDEHPAGTEKASGATGASADFDMCVQEESAGTGESHPRLFPLREVRVGNGRSQPKATLGGGIQTGFYLEQFSGSKALGPGASAEERARFLQAQADQLIQDLGPGSARERLGRIPSKLLRARGPEGRRVRRAVLNGALLVFFTAGYEGKRFVYETARKLGAKSVIIDHPDSWAAHLVEEGIVDKFIGVDMSQSSDLVFKQALQAIRRISSQGLGEPDGITTVVELSISTAARLAAELGLPGPAVESVDKARSKYATREALAAAGLPTPPHAKIESENDLEMALSVVGLPAVLKPVSGAASLGIKKVESAEQLLPTYRELKHELSSLVVASGALVRDEGHGVGVAAEKVINTCFVMERYLDGHEVDVDIVMSEGEWQYAAVSDNGPTIEPYFQETWSLCPSLLPRHHQVALKELAIGSVKALGFEDGVFHVECKYTSTGPQLIEVNARMGGGLVHMCNLQTWGVDLVEETLMCALGIPTRPDIPRKPRRSACWAEVNAMHSGVLHDLSFMEPLMENEHVHRCHSHVHPGDTVIGPEQGMPTWLCEFIVTKSNSKDARSLMEALEAEVQAKVAFV